MVGGLTKNPVLRLIPGDTIQYINSLKNGSIYFYKMIILKLNISILVQGEGRKRTYRVSRRD